jgi:hypothetical protein
MKTTKYSSDWLFRGGIYLHHFLRPEMMATVSQIRLKKSGWKKGDLFKNSPDKFCSLFPALAVKNPIRYQPQQVNQEKNKV